jgi:cell division septum initiation protein DivIVA
MRDVSVGPGRTFGRRPLGYDRLAVDRFLGEAAAAHADLETEVTRLQRAEPLTRVGDDLASLLLSFARDVSSMRDQAAADTERVMSEADAYAQRAREAADAYAEHARAAADAYAGGRKAEADQLVNEARAWARAAAAAIVDEARHEVAELVREQLTVGEALNQAAEGIEASRLALARLSRDDQRPIDIEQSGGGSPTRPRVAMSLASSAPVHPPAAPYQP